MSVFERIYHENGWRNDESVSGAGSTMAATKVIREALPVLFDQFNIESIADIPCGDMNWIAETVIGKRRYFGGDIVPGLISLLKSEYGGLHGVYFDVVDIVTDPLPKADLVLVRDLFGHLPNAKIKLALKNLHKSGSTYLLTTTFPEYHGTEDIAEGDWRRVNMAEYWGLGQPILVINEQCTVPGFEDKSLGLWRIS